MMTFSKFCIVRVYDDQRRSGDSGHYLLRAHAQASEIEGFAVQHQPCLKFADWFKSNNFHL